jgi:hypothetical protein
MAYKQNIGAVSVSISPPPGSIIAYLGSSDPDGWVILDGVSRVNDGRYNNLINMSIGSLSGANYTPPNYKGAFLRGTGTSSVSTNYAGANLKESQLDALKDHTHTTTNNGDARYLKRERVGTAIGTDGDDGTQPSIDRSYPLSGLTTGSAGGSAENRPFNYAVNWIAKL